MISWQENICIIFGDSVEVKVREAVHCRSRLAENASALLGELSNLNQSQRSVQLRFCTSRCADRALTWQKARGITRSHLLSTVTAAHNQLTHSLPTALLLIIIFLFINIHFLRITVFQVFFTYSFLPCPIFSFLAGLQFWRDLN